MRALDKHAEAREAMEGEAYTQPHALHNQADQWEALELARINEGRPPSMVATRLPNRCYEARVCNRYAQRDKP